MVKNDTKLTKSFKCFEIVPHSYLWSSKSGVDADQRDYGHSLGGPFVVTA